MMFLALLAYSNVLRVSCTAQHQRSSVTHTPLETRRASLKISRFHLTGTRQTSRFEEDGDTVAMIDVFVRPPSESCRILVSLDSLEDKNTIRAFQKGQSQHPLIRFPQVTHLGGTAETSESKCSSHPIYSSQFRKSLTCFSVLLGSLSTAEHLDRLSECHQTFVREGSYLYGM